MTNEMSESEFAYRCMHETMSSPENIAQLKDTVRWVSEEMAKRGVPIAVAISAFACLAKGARILAGHANAHDKESVNESIH